MRILVLLGVVASALAHPLPEDCITEVLTPVAAPLSYAAHIPHAAHIPYAAAIPHAPVVHHAVSPLAYAHATSVALPPAEVKIPVTKTHVEVPVHQQIHYGTQAYVSGATTSIHKPALAAPAIAPPSTLLSKISYKAPEVTVTKQEIPVEKHTPNYVETPYHAGTIVKYTAPEVKEVEVPTPYAVPQPVAVPHPVPVPAPVPSVTVHQPVAPVQYAAVSHAVAPVPAPVAPVAVAPAVQYAAPVVAPAPVIAPAPVVAPGPVVQYVAADDDC